MNFVPVSKIVIFCILNFCVMFVQGAEIETLNRFQDGEVTSAQQMNHNFDVIKRAINELNGDGISFASTKFIGFSLENEKVAGSDGLFALQRACRTLSSESHICSAQEISRSNYSTEHMEDNAYGNSNQAWVRGSLKLIGFKFDPKGSTSTADALNCNGWQDETVKGLVVDTQGKFSELKCDTQLRVACCQ